VNPEKIGFWGHSMGGHITLRSMVTQPDIRAGVIWAGVVAPYEDLFTRWHRRGAPSPSPEAEITPSTRGGRWRQTLSDEYGSPEDNKSFWQSLSANSYLEDISGPVQLHHGTGDDSVPFEFSEELAKDLGDEGKEVELYIYKGDDHNISNNFSIAAQRSVEFFDKYVK
jgi:dipeptidyl aminopeptidase/acylaminoacyl peptidase